MTSREQPVDAPTGLRYGEKKQLEDAQRVVPLPDNTTTASPPSAAPTRQVERPDVFAPTARRSEPLTAGAAEGPGPADLSMLPPDPVSVLRAIYLQYPSPGIRRLLERSARKPR